MPSKIVDSIKRRKGKCKQCGKCCWNGIGKFGFWCPFLNKNTGKCRIYKFRPFTCQLAPLDILEEEVERFKKLGCGYYWGSKEVKK
jgi:Fe-S-cluster containining protein